jgi:hypothetical protein
MSSVAVEIGAVQMNSLQRPVAEVAGFKAICSECGSLSIKGLDPAKSESGAIVWCGRCDASRGTLADLHALARQGKDLFEF